MLPILRTTLLGGALAALAFLAGFTVPEATRPHLARVPAPAIGPLADADGHPEWKQMMMLAALTRATELERLRDLPGQSRTRQEVFDRESLAKLAVSRDSSEPDDARATVLDAPENVMPVDIGASSSDELPVGSIETAPPAQRLQSQQPQTEKKPPVRKKRIVRAKPKPAPPATTASNPFEALFGSPQPQQTTQQ